jgi:EAL domain-containing protein (putative c-di-GMP-specific phosphodiesterase class I)
MKTIAEFVANEDIDREIRTLGIDYAQGYFYGKPSDSLL